MTREEKIAEARRLRAEGVPWRDIGVRLEIPQATIRRWVATPEVRRRYDRLRYERYERNKGTCAECGGPCTSTAERCWGCYAPLAILAALRANRDRSYAEAA